MEKRFALFLVLSALILFAHLTLQSFLKPPQQDGQDVADVEQPADAPDEAGAKPKPKQKPAEADSGDSEQTTGEATEAEGPDEEGPDEEAATPEADGQRPDIPNRRVTLGSMAPGSPYRLLPTFNSRGAAIERIELVQRTSSGRFRFVDLDDKSGYLGNLALSDESKGGCRVNVVAPGTPAASAQADRSGVPAGLKMGDIIQQIDDQTIQTADDAQQYLATRKPGQTVNIQVLRPSETAKPLVESFSVVLSERPLSVAGPEVNPDSLLGLQDQLSFLFSLERIGGKSVPRGEVEIPKLPSLRTDNWEVRELADTGTGPAVEFRFRLKEADLKKIGVGGALEVVKRYRLTPTQADQINDNAAPSYHLTMDLELHNVGSEEQQIAFRLDGPTGLPKEGWWYSNKIHSRFMKAAGIRDVLWSTPTGGRGLIGATKIYKDIKEAEENGQAPSITLFSDTSPQTVNYIGVDTPYFAVVLQPEEGSSLQFEKALAIAAGDVGTKKKSKPKTTNSTFRLISEPQTLAPGGAPYTQRFTIFAGPKQPTLLADYGLDRVIEYGWFRPIAKILASVLHFFERLPFVNYGLAIILLTVLVRSCMIPLSRKATKNAQMMQELAPEMKRISEKYKNDMEKRAAAQKELFSKNSYNPFGGCLLMLIQLPIFIGLYRSLSTDVELRQAPLIPGLSWCSNLAGPDMLWYWKPHLPAFFADETGWLGPYFNILPIITILLFLVQQKMFMPPATDDQTRMQQKMMKFMMLFMGVLFFRVPSGLCVYFIASSLWGVAERKLLPQVGKKKGGGGDLNPPGKKPDGGGKGPSATKKIALLADKLSNKLGADANVRTARSKRKGRKGR